MEGDKVVPLPVAASDAPAPGAAPAANVRDWASAIDLIKEASEAIRISEERANDLEMQFADYVEQAQQEIRRLNARISNGEQTLTAMEERARLAESRATYAEARATEAETWLARLHEALMSSLVPALRMPGLRPDDQFDAYKKAAE